MNGSAAVQAGGWVGNSPSLAGALNCGRGSSFRKSVDREILTDQAKVISAQYASEQYCVMWLREGAAICHFKSDIGQVK
jgi:hypothetical protein